MNNPRARWLPITGFLDIVRLLHIFAALTLLLGSAISHAANVNFNGGDVSNCPRVNTLYTCAVLSKSDAISIASGYGVTVNSNVTLDYSQSFAMSGTASLTVNGNVDFSNINTPNLKVTGGSITAKGGVFQLGSQNGQAIVADISAASVNLGGTPVRITGNITATGGIDISAGSTLIGAISGATVMSNSKVTIMGSVKASDTLSIGSNSVISGPVSGAIVTTDSNVTITGDVTASKSFNLGSGSNLKGNTTAPVVSIDPAKSEVHGNITASTSLTVGSHSQVTGNLTSPIIDLKASDLLVTGDVKASKTLIVSSGNGIDGNVEGGNVTLESAKAYITGNALVDHITLGSKGRVHQIITCKAYTPSDPCSCVTNNSGWTFNEPMGPKCGTGTQDGPHHFQIDHPGTALTCAPQTVTVTACADAACSAKYTGGANVTVSPGGVATPIDSSGVATASVRQYAVGTATLSLTSMSGTTDALVCKRSSDNSNSCNMAFAATGLMLTPANHISGTQPSFGISAVQASGDQQACVPLFANKSKDVTLACGYSNPASGTLPVFIKGTGAFIALAADNSSACSALGKSINLAFDGKGVATAIMSYADAGKVNLTATYTGSSASGDTGLSMTGSAAVIVVPKRFVFGAIATPQRAGLAVTPVAPATTISVSALNALGAVTPNFGKEATTQTVQLGHAIVAPLFTDRLDPEVAGSLTFNNGNGIGTAANMGWPEVGTIQFTASLPAYLGWELPPVNGITPPLAIGNSAGVQFIPHHFATTVTVTGKVPMPCVAPLTCVGAQAGQTAGKFVYSRQAFGLRITAQNASNATTINFDGQDKSLPANVALQAYDAATGKTVLPPADPAGSQLTDGTAAQTVVSGIAASNFKGGMADTVIAYRFPGAYAVPAGATALAPPTDVLFRATTTYPGEAVVTSAPSASGTDGQLTILTGRMMVPNSYGSERLPIRLPVQVQYWNGRWVSNASDSVTTFARADVVLANCRKMLTSGDDACNGAAKVQDGMYTFVAGFLPSPNGRLTLLAPGVPGSVDVSVPALSYLPSTVGSVVFGVLRSGPLIYLREMY